MVDVAQLVRAPGCGSGGRRFETDLPPKILKGFTKTVEPFLLLFMAWFKSEKNRKFRWIKIIDSKTYYDAIEYSYKEPILIFKHSTRCSISSLALNRIESNPQQKLIQNCYYLDLLSFREISNKIEQDFNIFHASPQILVIKDGKCVYNTSHNNIRWSNIKF